MSAFLLSGVLKIVTHQWDSLLYFAVFCFHFHQKAKNYHKFSLNLYSGIYLYSQQIDEAEAGGTKICRASLGYVMKSYPKKKERKFKAFCWAEMGWAGLAWPGLAWAGLAWAERGELLCGWKEQGKAVSDQQANWRLWRQLGPHCNSETLLPLPPWWWSRGVCHRAPTHPPGDQMGFLVRLCWADLSCTFSLSWVLHRSVRKQLHFLRKGGQVLKYFILKFYVIQLLYMILRIIVIEIYAPK